MDASTTAGSALRWIRAFALSTVALLTGVVGHSSADGVLPGPAALLALNLVVACAVAPLLGRQASTRQIILLLVGGQTFVHGALTALAGHTDEPVAAMPPGHVMDAAAHHVDPVAVMTGHLAVDFVGLNPAMAGVHLLAAVAVGLWLAAGERALWRLLALATRPVLTAVDRVVRAATFVWALAPVSASCCRRTVLCLLEAPPTRQSALWSRTVTRRGPPLPCAA